MQQRSGVLRTSATRELNTAIREDRAQSIAFTGFPAKPEPRLASGAAVLPSGRGQAGFQYFLAAAKSGS